MASHPGIVFRSGPTGRRAGLAGGPDVAEVIGFLDRLDAENVPDYLRLDRRWREADREHHGLVLALRRSGSAESVVGWLVRELDRVLQSHPRSQATSLVTWL